MALPYKNNSMTEEELVSTVSLKIAEKNLNT